MKVSLQWLEEFVDIDVPVEKLRELLDMSGTKVEAVHRPGGNVGGVVVAEVLAIDPHPNADNLILVDVSTGDQPRRVVCGARNFSVGDRVPYAQVGARLPDMVISERKIRGQASSGMLCSAAELGVSRDHSGILVLPADAALGEDVVAVLGLDDTILELEVTPNRPDSMSMVGVAREISVLLRTDLRLPALEVQGSEGLASPVEVEIVDEQACPRYLARYFEGVEIRPSPSRIARRLLACGIRPISNVVDATNYVLLELGQPLHAFDASLVDRRRIVVRRAREGERFVTLDGVERELASSDLLIADPRKALALAGIMGGQHSEVSEQTSSVILESAYFDPATIALTARRQLLRTEASARFERGADPDAVPVAATRAAELIVQLAGGDFSDAVVDAYPVPFVRPVIELRPARTDRVLGMAVSPAAQKEYLEGLGMSVTSQDGRLLVEVPGFRPDLRREEDLIEEVARLAGFDRLPSTLPPGVIGGLDEPQRAERAVRRALAGFGMFEAWTSSFGGPADLDALGLAGDHPARAAIALANPSSEEEPAMRTTLLPGLLRAAARNVAHRAEGVSLFELARVYEPAETHGGDGDARLPREGRVLAGVFVGRRRPKTWAAEASSWDFFAAKGVLEALFASLRIADVGFAPSAGMPFHPTRAAQVSLSEAVLGVLGELHPDVCDRFDVPQGSLAFEIALGPVIAGLGGKPRVEQLPRFPPVYLDMAVVVDEAVAAEAIATIVEQAGAPELASARLFDVYVGEQIDPGRKSLAFALELRMPDRTMTEEEALAVRDRIVAQLERETGASLRA